MMNSEVHKTSNSSRAKAKERTGSFTRVCVLVGLLSIWTMASASGEGLEWRQLDAAEREVLMPFAEQWQALPGETRVKLRQGAMRWKQMNPEARNEITRRFRQWQDLPANEKKRIRQRFHQFMQLPHEQQQRMRQTFRRFQHLPPAARQALRQRFQAMSVEERRAFQLGLRAGDLARKPTAAATPGKLKALPAAERELTARMLQTFTAEERMKFHNHIQKLRAGEKNAFRKKLLAMSTEQRRQFLLEDLP